MEDYGGDKDSGYLLLPGNAPTGFAVLRIQSEILRYVLKPQTQIQQRI